MSDNFPEIPQELVDAIIDNLHSDMDTLKQCSLVRKNWLPRSSRHLLRRVHWPPGQARLWKISPSGQVVSNHSLPCNCRSFAESSSVTCARILSSSPRLRLYIRDMKLSTCRYECHEARIRYAVLNLLTIATIMDRLPRLETLSLAHGPAQSRPSPTAPRRDYTLKRLHLNTVGIRDIPKFLSLFHRIECLSIGRLPGWRDDIDLSFDQSISTLEIECLDLSHCRSSKFVNALSRGLITQTRLSTLRRLSCFDFTQTLATVTGATTGLEHLTFNALESSFSSISPGAYSDSLTSMTLEGQFTLSYTEPPLSDTRLWETFCAKLAIFADCKLREIVFSLQLHAHISEYGDILEKGVYPAFEIAISRPEGWHTLGRTLDMFQSVHTFSIQLEFDQYEQQCLPILRLNEKLDRCVEFTRDVALRHLPPKYLNILHVNSKGV